MPRSTRRLIKQRTRLRTGVSNLACGNLHHQHAVPLAGNGTWTGRGAAKRHMRGKAMHSPKMSANGVPATIRQSMLVGVRQEPSHHGEGRNNCPSRAPSTWGGPAGNNGRCPTTTTTGWLDVRWLSATRLNNPTVCAHSSEWPCRIVSLYTNVVR